MITGFEKIIEERIKIAQKNGAFDNLPGSGKPLELTDDRFVTEELRLAYKILKNAGFTPPEIELKKKIQQAEELLEGISDASEKYRAVKKLNYMIMKLNSLRRSSIMYETPQKYYDKLVDCVESGRSTHGKK